ncbi:hypothetical protein PACTADRAFT_50042 [Pachysolen tannophilus NRRL Y-2460]|uniref:DNA-directed RNA polymerase subunit n=1 Tax=Pachysolen tannophilus NRRL Y-2460 TaxID=669874 RepID=A0A1E4TUG6_PACTA|nr:hypothetical protein PACTADRAFT_50042 [Pachysolen tannophilus NRRL Y-2460]
MFQLSVISDLISIPPPAFGIPIRKAIVNELNKKYANKVIPKLGLVITVWDIISIDDGLLKPGDASSYVKVNFRMVIWKPFVGEVLTGWIEKCTPEGIKVKLEFFNDIFIPKDYLFENSYYSEADNAWIWQPDEDSAELYLDINERINFRVEEEVFANVKPQGPKNELIAVNQASRNNDNNDDNDEDQDGADKDKDDNKGKVPPYAIVASCQTDGMGCVSWWE